MTTLGLAFRVWIGAVVVMAAVGGLTVAVAPAEARAALAFTFPPRETLGDFALVAAHNLSLALSLIVAARHGSRTLDVLFAAAAVGNLLLAGLGVGGYGLRLLSHAGVYGAVELAAFSLAAAIYIKARTAAGRSRARERLGSVVLVLAAAALETVIAIRL